MSAELEHVWKVIDGVTWCIRCLYTKKEDPQKQKPCRVVKVGLR